MILFCDTCRSAHHDKDMYSENLCYSCLYSDHSGPAVEGSVFKVDKEEMTEKEKPAADAKQGKLFE